MLVSKSFEGKKVISRRGVAKSLVISTDSDGTDLQVKQDTKSLEIVSGTSKHIIAKRIGVIGNAVINELFFVVGGMVFVLEKGSIVVDMEDGTYAIVSKTKTNIVKEVKDVRWVDYDSLIHNAKTLTKHKYGIDKIRDIDNYVNNLAFEVDLVLGSVSQDSWGLLLKVLNYYEDLGLGVFEFKKIKKDMNTIIPQIQEDLKSKAIDKVDDSMVDILVNDEDYM